MSKADIEFVQSFCRRYVNKAVREHFNDVGTDSDGTQTTSNPRSASKRLCLHEDTDPITLTAIRLLFWWIEAKGLFNEVIYGIPSDNFHESVVFKPQIVLHWRESREDAKTNNRYPTKARYSIRWKGEYATTTDVDKIRKKINNIFNKPTVHKFRKGREKYSYRDKIKGYEFIVTAFDVTEAKDVINKLLEIQDDHPLNEECLTKSISNENFTDRETIKVNGVIHTKPKKRPIGTVRFTHAEFKVHGMTRDILLTDSNGVNIPATTSE